MYLVTKKALKEWLEGNANRDVGQIQQPESCPLANFVVSVHGEKIAWCAVNDCEIEYETVNGHLNTKPLPLWARKFIKGVDDLPPTVEDYESDEYSDWDPITGEWVDVYEEYPIYDYTVLGVDALKVLEGV